MPKNGFRTITVSNNVYDNYMRWYKENREGLQFLGINSFTGFMAWIFQMVMSDDYIHDRIKNKIKDRANSVLINIPP